MATTPTYTPEQIQATIEAIQLNKDLSQTQREILANVKEVADAYNAYQKQIRDSRKSEEELRIERAKSHAERLQQIENETKMMQSLLGTVEGLSEKELLLTGYYTEREYNLSQINKELEEQLDFAQQEYNAAVRQGKKEGELMLLREKLLEAQEKLNKSKKEERIENDKSNAAVQGFTAALNLLGIRTHEQQLTMTEMFAAGAVNYDVMAKKFLEFVESGVFFRNIMASFGQKLIESTTQMIINLDSLRSEMFKATGGSKELTTSFMNLAASSGDTGTSFKEMNESLNGLLKTSSNFTELSNSQRESVARNNAQLVALGVSADVAGKNFSIFSQSLGMTINESNSASRELVNLAGNLNMSVSEVTEGFAQAAGTVAAYGQNAVREFSKLTAESKALGLSVQELIGIVKGADTFEGAAQQAGKLNAMLGGGLLNSSQLLVASESERIELIRDAVMQTGRSFSTMSKYEQIALANAAGIQDLTVAQKLFNQQMDGDELDRYLGKTNALGMSQEQMEEQAIAAKNAQEKLGIIMEQFALIMTPLINAFSTLMGFIVEYSGIIKFLSFVTGAYIVLANAEAIATNAATIRKVVAASATAALSNAKTFLGLVTNANLAKYGLEFLSLVKTAAMNVWTAITTFNLAAAKLALGNAAAFASSRMMFLVVVFLLLYAVFHMSGSPMLYAIFGFIAIGILVMGQAAEKSQKGLYAFGAAMLMVGIGAFLAFHGLEGFAIALSKLSPEQLNALVLIIFMLTVALVVMFAAVLYAGTAAIGPLLALGAAFLMMGAGAYLAALGFSILADSFIKLAQNMETLIMLPLFLQLMAVSLVAVSVGLAIFAYTLINVGLAMMVAYIPILAVIGAITALSLALNSIAPEKSFALKTTTEAISQFVTTGKNVTPETLANLEQVVKQIHDLNIEANISKAVNVVAPFKEIVDAINGQTQAQNEGQQTVVMKLDDKVFGSAVIKTMNSYGTANTSIRKPTPAGSGM